MEGFKMPWCFKNDWKNNLNGLKQSSQWTNTSLVMFCFLKYVTIYNNENLPNSITFLPK